IFSCFVQNNRTFHAKGWAIREQKTRKISNSSTSFSSTHYDTWKFNVNSNLTTIRRKVRNLQIAIELHHYSLFHCDDIFHSIIGLFIRSFRAKSCYHSGPYFNRSRWTYFWFCCLENG